MMRLERTCRWASRWAAEWHASASGSRRPLSICSLAVASSIGIGIGSYLWRGLTPSHPTASKRENTPTWSPTHTHAGTLQQQILAKPACNGTIVQPCLLYLLMHEPRDHDGKFKLLACYTPPCQGSFPLIPVSQT